MFMHYTDIVICVGIFYLVSTHDGSIMEETNGTEKDLKIKNRYCLHKVGKNNGGGYVDFV